MAAPAGRPEKCLSNLPLCLGCPACRCSPPRPIEKVQTGPAGLPEGGGEAGMLGRPAAKDATSDNGKDGLAYSALLKNELLGAGIEKVQDPQTEDRRLQPSTPEKRSLFTYSLSSKRSSPDDGNEVSPYSLSPISNKRDESLSDAREWESRGTTEEPFLLHASSGGLRPNQ